jgi:hypothetical protein
MIATKPGAGWVKREMLPDTYSFQRDMLIALENRNDSCRVLIAGRNNLKDSVH